MKDDCIFCKIIKGDISAEVTEEGDNFIVINDAKPVSDGHCLIIAKEHYDNVLTMPALNGSELIKLIKSQMLRLIKEGKADAVKVVQNNGELISEVQHYHTHIIPEKKGVKRERHV